MLLWEGNRELFDLPPGPYTVEVAALDKDAKAVVLRSVKVVHGESKPGK